MSKTLFKILQTDHFYDITNVNNTTAISITNCSFIQKTTNKQPVSKTNNKHSYDYQRRTHGHDWQ